VHLKHGYCMLIHFIHGYYCIYRLWQPLTYLFFPYCISLIYFSFIKIRMFLYARIYWLAEFGDVSCLQFNYRRVETLTPTWEDFVGHVRRFCRTILRVKSDKTLCPTWEYDRWYTWRDLYGSYNCASKCPHLKLKSFDQEIPLNPGCMPSPNFI
jgi:hypothetical protein